VSFRINIKNGDDIKIQQIGVLVLRKVVSSLSDYLHYVISFDNCNLTQLKNIQHFQVFMAFPQPNAQRELANRKILEDLQLKKQLLLKQGVASTLNSSALPVLGSTTVPQSDGYSMSSLQRAALQTANSQSTGYFISQDSSFGNLILPVLPRFDNNNK
jgi:hypothetical protein